MKKDEFIEVLDIGSEKVVCVVGKVVENDIHIIGLAEHTSEGLERGVIKSIDKTAETIQKVVEEVEQQVGRRIKKVHIGIKGEHIETTRVRSIINISRTNKEITEDDKNQVLYSVKNQVSVGEDKNILKIIPITYSVDGQSGMLDPKGMEASQLEIEAYVVTAATIVLNNLYKAVNNAGFKITSVSYNQIALADVCLVPEEKEVGVLLIDIGSNLTDISVYKNKRVFFNKELPIGGDLIVSDVSFGLRTSIVRARELVKQYGLAYFPKDAEDFEIKFLAVDGITERRVTQYSLTEIINARVEEIFGIIVAELDRNDINYNIPAGIVVTGGTAKLKYIEDVAKEKLNIPVRKGLVQNMQGIEDAISDMSYNTAIGLVNYLHQTASFDKQLFTYSRKKVPIFLNLKRKLEKVF
ncbi:MAG: cell division protein FtsA [bacterium]|nr:cell division protein FtsA [bacterium]